LCQRLALRYCVGATGSSFSTRAPRTTMAHLGSWRLFRQMAHVSVTTFHDQTATAVHFFTLRNGACASNAGEATAAASEVAFAALAIRGRFCGPCPSILRLRLCVVWSVRCGHCHWMLLPHIVSRLRFRLMLRATWYVDDCKQTTSCVEVPPRSAL
jgi:hypothetical protein